MKVPYGWLTEYVPGAPSPETVAARLAIVGTEVDRIIETGVPDGGGTRGGSDDPEWVGGGAGYKVGRVVSFEQHPNADRLRLCAIDVGEDAPRQIVCGASNFDEGDLVAVVLPGATLPGGSTLGTAKLRGIESFGMLLSERELELSQDHAGIMVLPADWTPGTPLGDQLPIGDTILDLEITPNRPDCLGVHGIAREVAAAFDLPLAPVVDGDADAVGSGHVDDVVSVTLEADDLCQRYMARAFVDIEVAPSPPWLRARLAQCGMRAINNVVDVTNYVMLATGQPLHAFDADRIRDGRLVVRRAADGETVTTLDDVERTLESCDLVIADGGGTLVIAGVMGAADAEVTDSTTRIVLEAATFAGPSINRTSSRLGLRSESSGRFEKGLDAHSPEIALRLASQLLVELCDARRLRGTVDCISAATPLQQPTPIILPSGMAGRVLGAEIPATHVETTLRRLGFTVASSGEGWVVTPPHFRMLDVTRPIDLVEEIGRMYGLDRIPARLPSAGQGVGRLSSGQRMQRTIEDTLATLGLHEAVTYSLVDAGEGQQWGTAPADVLRLANPMTGDHAELRSSLVPSLLRVVARNRALGTDDVAVFEVGREFRSVPVGSRGADGLPSYSDETRVVTLALAGKLHGGWFDTAPMPADLPAMAGVLTSVGAAIGIELHIDTPTSGQLPAWLHPGQCAIVRAEAAAVGWLGVVHPGISKQQGIRGDVVVAQFELHALQEAAPTEHHAYRAISTFPPVRQDLAVLVAGDVRAADLLATVRAAAGELLESVRVFDRYVGDQVTEGQMSIALALTFRALDRTLTDDDVLAARGAVVSALEADHGARLREG